MTSPSSLGKPMKCDENQIINDLQKQLLDARQEISRIKEDNNTLKAQYNEAMNLTKQLDNIHQENTTLQRNISKLTAEKDEISRRLQINLEMNEDLKNKLKNQERSQVNRVEINELRNQLEQSSQNHQKQLSELNSVVEETTQILNTVRNENSELRAVINGLIEAGESYFGEKFSSPESLRQFLLMPKPQPEISMPKPIEIPPPVDSAVLKSYKSKLKSEKKLRKEIALRLKETEENHSKQREQFQSIIDDLEMKITSLEKTTKDTELRQKQEKAESNSKLSIHEDTINRLKLRIQQLKEQNDQLEELQSRPNPLESEVRELKNQISTQSSKLKENSSTISKLKDQISTLISQLKSSEMKSETLKKKVDSVKSLNETANKDLIHIKTENGKINLVVEELQEKLKTANAQIQSERSSLEQNSIAFDQLNSNYLKSKASNDILQKALERQKDEIALLYKDRESLTNLVQKSHTLLLQFDNYCYQLKKKQKKLSEEKQIETKIVETIVEPEIPLTSWLSTEFSRDLTDMIKDVAKNESLPINAKLRHVLSIIGKYYNSQISDKNKQINEKIQMFNELSDKYINYLNAVGSQFELDLTTFSDPIQPTLEKVMSIKDSKSSSEIEKNLLSKKVDDILEKIEVDSLENIEKKVARLQIELNAAQNKFNQEKKKAKYQQKTNKKLLVTFQEHQQKVQEVFNKQKQKIDELEKDCDNSSVEIRQLKGKNLSLTNDMTRLREEHEDHINEINMEKDAFLKQMRDEYEKEKTELLSIIDNKTKKIEVYCRQLVKLEKEASQWKRATEEIKKQKKERERELDQMQKQAKDDENEWKQRIEREKADLTTQFNSLINELKSKNKELRTLLKNAGTALNESQDKIKDLSLKLAESETNGQQNEVKLNALKDEIEREKQLNDTKLKAAAMSHEMKSQKIVEEERNQQIKDKRKLFGFVAKSFRQYFDGSQQLNDDSFKSLINQVSDDVERMTSQEAALRRLLGIGQSESIQDSVAKLLLSGYRSS